MNRRGYEGPMDWEYQHQPQVDPNSPFVKYTQKPATSIFESSSSSPSKPNNNLFAANVSAFSRPSPLKPQQQSAPPPPHSSFFNPQIRNKPSAPAFRNPAFTTPQKRIDELAYSEFSGAETSPAMTDTSETPADTPEVDRDEDFRNMTITPNSPSMSLFKSMRRSRTPGKGELARGNRDRVRKRKRIHGDKDVGSVRNRLSNGSDDSDSDWEDTAARGKKAGKAANRGVVSSFLAAISDHPSAPAILSKWLQLGVNMVFMGFVLAGILTIWSQIRADLSHASEKARAAIVQEAAVCSQHYLQNKCAPRALRAPALEGPCNEWEACMNQDDSAIMKLQVSARNVAEIMNEFVGVMTFKTWGFIMSLFLATVIASNLGFGYLRESTLSHSARPADPLQSPPVTHPMLGATAHHNPQQAYIWAPISETPRHIRRNLFNNHDATDTENSPEPTKSIMPPPQTPSGRGSPSKGDRGRSPSKRDRSPSKGY
ncbi:Di-sulfide bridge nucleocytoplasmic transport domain-containing protein [Bombardia bombarda]|uniref:Di-sulfide bridge nucleocytoplasmic transport domain-containing protein n=1 Tax=Bombardia bombarda TaxID=252184 RepID=A0AA40C8N7_9PEZI|nr:Di-sulfide bridge nucleocytoplasmic transport domain-containing protein [Bombardia bombarda]